MTHFGKIIEKVQWIESKSFRHFYSKQNMQQNLRHKNVYFQCKLLQEIFVIVLILYSNLTFLAFRAYLLEPPPQDYITKGKTFKNLNVKKCDKNYYTHSRIRIATYSYMKCFSRHDLLVHKYIPSTILGLGSTHKKERCFISSSLFKYFIWVFTNTRLCYWKVQASTLY